VARSSVSIKADFDAAAGISGALAGLQPNLISSRHQQQASRAAFELLSEGFNLATAAAATAAPANFEHVYEPGSIGIPQQALWQNVMIGRSNLSRAISWEWRASKQLVDPKYDSMGNLRFPDTSSNPGFDADKLHKVHIFVWKAPIMEYGLEVTVRPKLSENLVFPNPGLRTGRDTDSRAPRPVIFSPHSYSFVPGEKVQGSFTAWFLNWWENGDAQAMIDGQFDTQRDNAFRGAFAKHTARYFNKPGRLGMRPIPASTAEGTKVAALISGELERHYIEMAAKRRRRNL